MNLINILDKNARLYHQDAAFIEIRPVSKIRNDLEIHIKGINRGVGFKEAFNILHSNN